MIIYEFIKRLLFVSILIVGLHSCDKADEVLTFYWNQTKCSDPWNAGENDSQEHTIQAVSEFLAQEDIVPEKIEMDTNSPLDAQCEACHCGTGKRIIVHVPFEYEQKMESLNFYQNSSQ